MLDRRKKFEFSIESSVGQEQDWSTSQISGREDHFGVGAGHMRVSVHTSRAGKRVNDKSDDS